VVPADWKPIASFFETEPETPCVLLWASHSALGECCVQVGFWEPDEHAWYRDGEGPDEESEPLVPTHWMPLPDGP
jgi:hypothetical protein